MNQDCSDLAETDLEASLKDTASLRHIAQGCGNRFGQLMQIEDSQSVEINARDGYWVSRQSAEFNMWCARLGVHCEGLRSIDVRLKDVPEICDLLLLLLQSLRQDLDNTLRYYAGLPVLDEEGASMSHDQEPKSETSSLSFKSLSSSEASQASSANGVATAPREKCMIDLRKHIEDTLTRLQGHARRIERAGAEHRRKRVEFYRQKENPKQIYENFKTMGRIKAHQQFPRASAIVTERLAEAFARRRIRFEYLREHQKKRAVQPMPHHNVNSAQPSPPSVQTMKERTSPEILGRPEIPVVHGASDQQTILSQTINTELNLSALHIRKERAESVISTISNGPGFPHPPQIIEGRFQCPYCCLDFHKDEAEEGRWR